MATPSRASPKAKIELAPSASLQNADLRPAVQTGIGAAVHRLGGPRKGIRA